MMLIFEEIQINTSDGVYQKPPPLLQLALFGMISMCLQGNKKTERSSDNEKRRDADCQLRNLELNLWELILKYCKCMS